MVTRVDLHVGKRIRHRRWSIGMSQQELGEKIGVKFQQVQKYETGSNRVSASKLWELSRVLGVRVGYFFDGLNSTSNKGEKVQDTFIDDFKATSFVSGYYKIPKDKRQAIFDFAMALAEPDTGEKV